MINARPTWRRLLWQATELAWALALDKTGNNKPASPAMMAMTTSNSIRLKPRGLSDLTGGRPGNSRLGLTIAQDAARDRGSSDGGIDRSFRSTVAVCRIQ